MSNELLDQNRVRDLLFNLSKGLSVSQSCAMSDVARSTYYSWLDDPDFARRVEIAKSSLLSRAWTTIDNAIDNDPTLALKIIQRQDKIDEQTLGNNNPETQQSFTIDVIPSKK